MNQANAFRLAIARRLRDIRINRFGDGEGGIVRVSAVLEIEPGTWRTYEACGTISAYIAIRILDETGIGTQWLLTGQGEQYTPIDFYNTTRV